MLSQRNKIAGHMRYDGLKRISYLTVLLLLSLRLYCQEEFIPSPSRLLTSIPFTTFTGGVVVIRAQIGDIPDSLNFIFDTGSAGISLDSLTCVRLKLNPQSSDKTIRGIAGIRPVKFVYHEKLHIGGISVDSL